MYSLSTSFWTVPRSFSPADSLTLGDELVQEEQQRRRRVDRHRGRDLAERDSLEQSLHVGDRVDRDAGPPDLALGERVVRVVAELRREVERDGEPGLAAIEEVAEARVRLLGRAVARVLAHRPRTPAVHRSVGAARERELAGELERLRAEGRPPCRRASPRCRSRSAGDPRRSPSPAKARCSTTRRAQHRVDRLLPRQALSADQRVPGLELECVTDGRAHRLPARPADGEPSCAQGLIASRSGDALRGPRVTYRSRLKIRHVVCRRARTTRTPRRALPADALSDPRWRPSARHPGRDGGPPSGRSTHRRACARPGSARRRCGAGRRPAPRWPRSSCEQGRARVQADRRLDDAAPRLRLPLGAPLELVLSSHCTKLYTESLTTHEGAWQ